MYFGDDNQNSTSSHRAHALIRLGHDVSIYNPKDASQKHLRSKFISLVHYHTGFRFVQKKIVNWLEQILKKKPNPDIIWVNNGEFFGPNCLKVLKKVGCPIILYNNDDPTGGRDGRRFDSMLRSIPYYDLCAVVREINVSEYKSLGAKKIIRIKMSYDEVAHHPLPEFSTIPEAYQSEVVFIGTWMRHEKRDEFVLQLIKHGINISIWGPRWEKSPHWETLKTYHKGGMLGGEKYITAIQGAKVCLGLLSKGNRDMYTQRSIEITYAGGLLCAERTQEHLEMYQEWKEAVFWSDTRECAEVCKRLLEDNNLRENIRKAGNLRVKELHIGNEDICNQILNAI